MSRYSEERLLQIDVELDEIETLRVRLVMEIGAQLGDNALARAAYVLGRADAERMLSCEDRQIDVERESLRAALRGAGLKP